MDTDIRDLLGRAAPDDVPDPQAAKLVKAGLNRRRRRSYATVCAAVVVVTVASLATNTGQPMRVDLVDDPSTPPSSRADDTVPLGPAGSVSAEWLDGHPVWVVHDEASDVTVLDAVNPHSRFGVDELVGWCESSGWFEAGGDGSRFDAQGRYAFGPAPHGLVPYDVALAGDGMVRVGERQEPTPRGEGYDDAVGPHCSYALDDTEQPVARYHPVDGSGRQLFNGIIVPGDGGQARFCPDADAVDAGCPDDALVVPEVTSFPDAGVLRNSILARQDEGVLRDVIYLPAGSSESTRGNDAPMRVRPNPATPGATLRLTFPRESERGVAFVLRQQQGDGSRVVYELSSDGGGAYEPAWYRPGESPGYPSVGIGGRGPDRVPVPDDAPPGEYLVCTANARRDICAPLTIVANNHD